MILHYIHLDSIDSTNSWARRNAHILEPTQITCITAQEQTAGRGRFDRQWISPKGQNIYVSICFFTQNSAYLSNLGQVLSFSLCTILKRNGFFPQIKWPNDILLSGKKVAGVLTEVIDTSTKISNNDPPPKLIILGIGINVNMSATELKTINQPATSLAQISSHEWDPLLLLKLVVTQFIEDLKLLQAQSFSAFLRDYEELLAYKGTTITCNGTQGTLHSINPNGTLNLELPSGQMMILTSGEIQK